MPSTAAFAETAALVGHPARANMLAALLDGGALTATELAHSAGITPQTASGHLARLANAGLLVIERQGRHRYHRLATPAIAHMLEEIMTVAEAGPGVACARRPVVVGPRDTALRTARTCYDHLAGRLAVKIADAMAARGQIELAADGGAVTPDGEAVLRPRPRRSEDQCAPARRARVLPSLPRLERTALARGRVAGGGTLHSLP